MAESAATMRSRRASTSPSGCGIRNDMDGPRRLHCIYIAAIAREIAAERKNQLVTPQDANDYSRAPVDSAGAERHSEMEAARIRWRAGRKVGCRNGGIIIERGAIRMKTLVMAGVLIAASAGVSAAQDL